MSGIKQNDEGDPTKPLRPSNKIHNFRACISQRFELPDEISDDEVVSIEMMSIDGDQIDPASQPEESSKSESEQEQENIKSMEAEL